MRQHATCMCERERKKKIGICTLCVCVSPVRTAVRRGERADKWMLLTLSINGFTTEIASSIAVTPLELCDILCRMYCVCVCVGVRGRERESHTERM